ncbi:MAG: tetratricopeptide repeat protein [Rhodobacteraceae bacterium]|nr:tetratricopeptide repeat protein [Paracoccaceae bacterium]
MRALLFATALAIPGAALAVGTETDTPPTPTKTTTECTDGQIWDEKTETCTAPQESRLDDDTLYGAAREFAYAGQYQNTLNALAAMSDPTEDRVLTYLGFAHRKLGDTERGMDFYRQALAVNPDNLLARSYMGMALAEEGDMVGARAELSQIRARGGRDSWPAFALKSAIAKGPGEAY